MRSSTNPAAVQLYALLSVSGLHWLSSLKVRRKCCCCLHCEQSLKSTVWRVQLLYFPGPTSLFCTSVVMTLLLFFTDHLPVTSYNQVIGLHDVTLTCVQISFPCIDNVTLALD